MSDVTEQERQRFYVYDDDQGKHHQGYVEMINALEKESQPIKRFQSDFCISKAFQMQSGP